MSGNQIIYRHIDRYGDKDICSTDSPTLRDRHPLKSICWSPQYIGKGDNGTHAINSYYTKYIKTKKNQTSSWLPEICCLQNRLINPLKRYIFEYTCVICSDWFLNEVQRMFLCGVDKTAKLCWLPAPAALGSDSCFLSAGNTVRTEVSGLHLYS